MLISYSLVTKIDICLKYILEKKILKRPKWAGICGVSKWKLLSAFVRRKAVRLPNHILLSFFFPVSVSTFRSHWISKSSCLFTPAKTLSISGLKSRVLKLSSMSLKMMVKSGLEFILKFTEPLQRYLLTCQANSAFMGRFFLHWVAATLKLLVEF